MAIPQAEKIVSEVSGVERTVSFSAKLENLGHIFNILRSQLYSDPIKAVIREISTNAFDAHISKGHNQKPFRVTMPTQLECFFKVRDFGPGLSDEQVQEIFCSYGESTKRNDREANGMLGIGCKSPFAYTDSFIVNSYQGGKVTFWNCFIDPSNRGSMSKMGSDDTVEQDGLEVVIPVKNNDIEKFHQKAYETYRHFSTLPEILHLQSDHKHSLDTFRASKPTFSGKDWFIYDGKNSAVVMANVAYPLNASVFTDGEIDRDVRHVLENGFVIHFQNGEVEFAASREGLQYTPATKKKLINKINEIVKELTEKGLKVFDGVKTLWEARLLYHNLSNRKEQFIDMPSFLVSLIKNKLQKTLKINGFTIDERFFNTGYRFAANLENRMYNMGWNGLPKSMKSEQLPCDPTIIVVENDTGIVNGIANRLIGLLSNPLKKSATSKIYSAVYLLKFTDAASKATWIKETGFDGPIVSLVSLQKQKLNDYVDRGTPTFNIKHSKKEFEYVIGKRSYGSPSDCWNPVEVDVENDEIVYVPLERFKISNGLYHGHPHNLSEFIVMLGRHKIKVPKIYGLKQGSADLAAKNPKAKTIRQFIENEIADYFKKNPTKEQELIDLAHFGLSSEDNYIIEWANKWKMDKSSPFYKYAQNVKDAKVTAESLKDIRELINLISYQAKGKPATKLRDEKESIKKLYPMFFIVISGSYINSTVQEELKKYVQLIDAQ